MTRVIVDEVLRNKLHNLTQPLELCDESGRLVGRVFPAEDLSRYKLWEPPITDQEVQQLLSSEKWYTTAEVLTHLGNDRQQENCGKAIG
jgi:hypothetical protein